MNEFTVKKMAEVQAFVDLSKQIIHKGGVALSSDFPKVVDDLKLIAKYPTPTIDNTSLSLIFDTKRQKTLSKLEAMMELYIGSNWNNSVEILEWLSFYTGSASAHAALTSGALESTAIKDEAQSSSKLSELFWQLLVKIKLDLSKASVELARS